MGFGLAQSFTATKQIIPVFKDQTRLSSGSVTLIITIFDFWTILRIYSS